MTTTFADYVSEQDARNTIQLNATKWTLMLCDALKQNYIEYSIKNSQKFLKEVSDDYCENYYHEKIDQLKQGISDYYFIIESGRKYHKIIMEIDCGADVRPSRSVHAFVDKKTGEVYKSASWKSPAKGVRYDLRIIEQREWLLENADWSGCYLYAK
jgi:hypothetical protein